MAALKHSLLALALMFIALPGAADTVVPEDTLVRLLTARSEEDRSRDTFRHPAATLAFFQVAPGMTVAEGLPSGGWYTRILAGYLGGGGTLYGVNYADRMLSMFSFATPEWVEKRKAATALFPEQVAGYTDNGITARGFTFETVPADVSGTVDRVLLIRALHNLNRFEAKAQTRSRALAAIHHMLREGGLVGVVQHRAPESAPDDWADGSSGYLKQTAVIRMFEEAGFELVSQSEINANPNDQPGTDDIVWRLPPSLRGSEEDADRRAAMLAIGESDRMTLLFRKGSG
jgi:predicted methyltransferase